MLRVMQPKVIDRKHNELANVLDGAVWILNQPGCVTEDAILFFLCHFQIKLDIRSAAPKPPTVNLLVMPSFEPEFAPGDYRCLCSCSIHFGPWGQVFKPGREV